MSTYDSGQRVSNFVRNGAGRVPTPRLTESLDAPGLVAAPPEVTSGQRVAYDIIQSLGAVDRIADSTSQIARIQYAVTRDQQAEIDRQTAEDRRLDAEALDLQQSLYEAQQAHGVNVAREDIPIVASALAESTAIVPPEQVKDHVAAIIAKQTDGMDPAAAEAYARTVTPRLIDITLDRNTKLRDIARDKTTDTILRSAETVLTPDEAAAKVDTLVNLNPEVSRDKYEAAVYGQSLKHAATFGTEDQFKMALASLPEGFSQTDKEIAVQHYETRLERERTAKVKAYDNLAGTVTIDVRDGSITSEQARARLEPIRKDVGDEKFNSYLNTIDAEAQQRLNRLRTENDAAVYESKKHEYVTSISQAMADPSMTLSHVPDETIVTLPSGEEKKIVAKDFVPQIIAAEVDRINQALPITPDMSATMQTEVRGLRMSGVASYLAMQGPKATYEPWRDAWTAMASQAMSSQGKAENVPPAAVQAFVDARYLENLGYHGVIESHMGDNRDLFRLASLRMDMGDDAKRALAKASVGIMRPKPTSIESDKLATFASEVAADMGASNDSDVRHAVEVKADLYARASGVSIDTPYILERVAKDIAQDYAVVDGKAVYRRGMAIPHNIDAVAVAVKDAYGKSDAVFDLDTANQLAEVRNADGSSVDGVPELNMGDVRSIASYINKVDLANAIARKSPRQAERAALLERASAISDSVSPVARHVMEHYLTKAKPAYGIGDPFNYNRPLTSTPEWFDTGSAR